jgi:hypothetical protein
VSGPARGDDGLEIRRAAPADRDAVIRLLAASLGRDDDPRFEALYAWKHETNAFGPSPAWVACDGDRVVGFRALMRWRFRYGDRRVSAVRAVDTATHPEYQGRRIFTRLTLHGIDELRGEGVDWVFNTPNSQSRPGYLKMGWQVVGRLPVSVRPRGARSIPRLAGARTAAERWSEPCADGEPALDVLADAAVPEVLASQPRTARVRTDHSLEYLRWRYGIEMLAYRAVVSPRGAGGGFAIVRVRRRGAAREVVVDDVFAPDGDRRATAAVLREVARVVRGDYLIRIGGPVVAREAFVRLPRQGPILTWRDVCDAAMPSLEDWDLTMGDVELF